VRLKNGRYAYKGLHHRHWTRKFFSPRWRCWLWFCPCTEVWYYWCGSRGYFLEVRYLVVSAPSTMDPDSTIEQPPEADQVPEATQEEVPDLPEPQD
jgi:hypothetical protein